MTQEPPNSHPGYRPEIDGLRAIAVLSVLLDHLGFPGAGGGYVGVDVFFVISGFLITGIVLKATAAGQFSLGLFYERRVRRILPPLVVVLCATILAGHFLLLSNDLENLGQSAVSVALFASNIFFWIKADYFAPAAESLPLLHTWSLGVEEQFYIVWPLVLVAAARLRPVRLRLSIFGVLLVSLAGAQLELFAGRAETAFYLPHLRAWELMLGALLATLPPSRLGRGFGTALSYGGFLCVVVPVFAYSPATLFPGLAALIPCVGTAALIVAGGTADSLVFRVLRSRPFRYVGLISYSLYLWHWPPLAFYAYVVGERASGGHALALGALGWLFADLSWRFVERPFRAPRPETSRRTVFVSAAAALAIGASAGLFLHFTHGLPARLAPEVRRLSSYIRYESSRPEECRVWSVDDLPSRCQIGDRSGGQVRRALVWGDSHAEHLLPALDLAMSRAGIVGTPLVKLGCLPIPREFRPDSPRSSKGCDEFNRQTLSRLLERKEFDLVVLVARWSKESAAPGAARVLEGTRSGRATTAPLEPMRESLEKLAEALARGGLEVALIGQVPEFASEPTKCLAVRAQFGLDDQECGLDSVAVDEALRRTNATLAAVAARIPGTTAYYPSEALCEGRRCAVTIDGIPLYRDSDHLTAEGSARLAHLFDLSADRRRERAGESEP